MKKYIRTKNGHICKIRNKQERLNGEYDTWYVGNNVSLLYNHNHNIIEKEADTIDELCDEFVVFEYGNESGVLYSRNQYDTFENAINSQISKHKCLYEIYGAIWTDKGLIYVAKMNEKGELELL